MRLTLLFICIAVACVLIIDQFTDTAHSWSEPEYVIVRGKYSCPLYIPADKL